MKFYEFQDKALFNMESLTLEQYMFISCRAIVTVLCY